MKKIFLALLLISLFCSLALYFYFDYHIVILGYHFIVIGILFALVGVVYHGIGYVNNDRLRIFFRHLICISFFFTLAVFYLVLIGSLSFWGKAIEWSLLISYLSSLNRLIGTLPVQGWMLYTFLIIFATAIAIAYYYIRPKQTYTKSHHLKRDLILCSIGAILMVIFYQPLIEFKRKMHAADEPILSFVFPRTYHTQEEKDLYNGLLIKNAVSDRPCEEQVKKEGTHSTQRNVMLIIIDALRSDHLSAYGYHRPTTPFLDSMVRAGDMLRIQHAFSPATNTLSGIANLFSSKPMEDFSFGSFRLMKYMQMKKFTTYAFLTGAHSKWYWLTDIYRNNCDVFYESNTNLSPEDDDFLTLKKFNTTKLADPFFVYMHLLSTHILGKKDNQFKKFLPDKIGIGVDKKTALTNNYDNGILQADYLVREVFKKLESTGQLKNTTIFVMADHGELLGEDGRWGHNESVQPYLQSIPLLIYDQDTSWYQNRFSATLLDVSPTIADRMGYSIPDCWTGRSLHQKLKDYKILLSGVMPCDFPFGTIYNKDSAIWMEMDDKNHAVQRKFNLSKEDGVWHEVQLGSK